MASLTEKIQSNCMNALEAVLDATSGDVESICADANKHSVSSWKTLQITKGVTIGAGAAVIPIAGYLTLPADFVTTLRIMHRAATGISYIKLGHADEETFAGILGVWSGAIILDDSLKKQIVAKVLATAGTTVGGAVGLKMSIKALSMCTGVLVGKKLGAQTGVMVATKLGTKMTAKATTRWIPAISAITGGAVNWWIVNAISNAAEEYAEFVGKIGP